LFVMTGIFRNFRKTVVHSKYIFNQVNIAYSCVPASCELHLKLVRFLRLNNRNWKLSAGHDFFLL
jgi:hypothetical protein